MRTVKRFLLVIVGLGFTPFLASGDNLIIQNVELDSYQRTVSILAMGGCADGKIKIDFKIGSKDVISPLNGRKVNMPVARLTAKSDQACTELSMNLLKLEKFNYSKIISRRLQEEGLSGKQYLIELPDVIGF